MKIHPIAELESDWYPKNAITAFKKYAESRFVDNPQEADLIWIFSYYMPLDVIATRSWLSRLFGGKPYRRRGGLADIPIITTVHHLTPSKEKQFLPFIEKVDGISDAVQFFSTVNVEICRRYFTKPIFVHPYWIDLDVFASLDGGKKKDLRTKFGLPSDIRVIGSFQRDTESDCETPKYEKGPDIFCDIIERLDPNLHMVLLAGVRRHYVEKRLREAGISFLNLGKVSHERMPELYSCLDCYLVTSRVEGGPQAILESMATGTPIFSTPVGIHEALDPAVICETVDDFVQALVAPYPDVIGKHLERIQDFEVRNVVGRMEETFAHLIEGYRRSPADLARGAPEANWCLI